MLEKFKQQLAEKKEVYLRVKVSPGAPLTCLKQIMADETLKIAVAAPAQKGKANAELIKFLRVEFDVDKDNIKILVGAGDPLKLVKIIK